MAESFTTYQRQMWSTLAHCGIYRYYIDVSPENGRYFIRRLSVWNEAIFWAWWANTAFKFVYHLLTYHGLLGVEVHFLDQMSIWDWLLMYFHIFLECSVWFFKYPFWENLYRQWELQEDIYRKLGRPKKAAEKITRTDSLNFYIYGGICFVGTFALIIQFFETPKYALNTYAIVPADNFLLRVLFCLHECFFMCSGYAYQGFTMVLAESYAVSYQHLLEEMNKTMNSLMRIEKVKSMMLQGRIMKRKKEKALSNSLNGFSSIPEKTKSWSKIQIVNPRHKAPGTQYDIITLVEDYRKVMISSQFHNQWVGAIIGAPQLLNYGQFVSDVFMMIQLLKEEGEETDYLAVFFYIMDASFGMVMLFRMLIILSRLVPQSEAFLRNLKCYTSLNTPIRKELLKTLPSLRIVSAKLTGYTIRPQSVPIGIHTLINWYIMAAMWQRPKDRMT